MIGAGLAGSFQVADRLDELLASVVRAALAEAEPAHRQGDPAEMTGIGPVLALLGGELFQSASAPAAGIPAPIPSRDREGAGVPRHVH
jgi:hypothetical protein